jgi:mono/diheme cytochrome c family protein
VSSVTALSGNATTGATLYANSCAQCHGASGQGASRYPRIAGTTNATRLADVMLYGKESMPAFSDLSDQELADIIAAVEAM